MIETGFILCAVLLAGLFAYITLVSIADGEKRAARIGLIMAIGAPIPFVAVSVLDSPFLTSAGITSIVVLLLAAVTVALPIRSKHSWGNETPETRIDERDIMFSRRLLQPGTERFAKYYGRKPEKKVWDDKFRCRPGLLASGAAQYDPISFHAATSSFETIEKLRPFVDGDPASERVHAEPKEIKSFIVNWILKLGGHSAGVTRLQDFHKYSVVGRGPDYGQPVTLEHEYAIAFTVEMNKQMLDAGPQGPTVMESSQKYVDSGVVAVQVAQFIRSLGYGARAHIDGNYRVVCPLVARDAGLGEIGRMGLLMTPDLGPRVRIGVVTTDMPLEPDRRTPDDSVLDFCTHCRKCATSCPPWAIPFDDRTEIDGISRWQINQELCYIYWSHTGTDCGRCVAVCPYSHPDRLVHNLVRWGVRRSWLFRRLAIHADRLFYGKKPEPGPIPNWMQPAIKNRIEEFSSWESRAPRRT